jgi:hypothetical protein
LGDLDHSHRPPGVSDAQFNDFSGVVTANRPVNWAVGGGLGEIAEISSLRRLKIDNVTLPGGSWRRMMA